MGICIQIIHAHVVLYLSGWSTNVVAYYFVFCKWICSLFIIIMFIWITHLTLWTIYSTLRCRLIYKMNAEVCTTCHKSAETRCLTSKSNVYFYNQANIMIILRWIKMNASMNIKENSCPLQPREEYRLIVYLWTINNRGFFKISAALRQRLEKNKNALRKILTLFPIKLGQLTQGLSWKH